MDRPSHNRHQDRDDTPHRSNKRGIEDRDRDRDRDRDSKRPKQHHHNHQHRHRRPQQSQDEHFCSSNKKHIDHTVEDNKRLRAELTALKASIAQGDIHINSDTTSAQLLSHSDAVAQLPPPTEGTPPDVALYTPFTVAGGLPQLPPVADDKLRAAVFKHKSIYPHHRDGVDDIVTYEKLEYLGDAYLELFASRLIYHRFPTLGAGEMSSVRETMVKNETLALFSKAYGFDKKVEVDKSVKIQMEQDKANKGFNKVLGDVLEAYVAAVVLSHEDGFAAAEKWLTALWAPIVLKRWRALAKLIHTDDADPIKIFDPTACQELSNRVGNGRGCKLEYKPRPTVELKGDHLGQNLWIIDLRVTGYGYSSHLLSTGSGTNQKEAKAWAAIKAMHGENKAIVEECEAKCRESREQYKAQKEAQIKQEGGAQSQEQEQIKAEKEVRGKRESTF